MEKATDFSQNRIPNILLKTEACLTDLTIPALRFIECE